jgi:hypothetical protein
MFRKFCNTLRLIFLIVSLLGGQAAAQNSSSSNYQTNEYMFGVGGGNSDSASYQAETSAGSLGAGSSASESYLAEAGFLTPREPFLEMVVTEDSADLGELPDDSYTYGTAQGGGCNCSFNVRSYLSSSYVVYTMSNPPTNESGDILPAKSTLGVPSSNPAVAEFGMNLVANTAPSAGANPVNVPDNSFADGAVETGYNAPNQFKYNIGDIIAKSPGTPGNQAVGQTNFTITYVAKRADLTPAGLYQMDHVLVVVATY